MKRNKFSDIWTDSLRQKLITTRLYIENTCDLSHASNEAHSALNLVSEYGGGRGGGIPPSFCEICRSAWRNLYGTKKVDPTKIWKTLSFYIVIKHKHFKSRSQNIAPPLKGVPLYLTYTPIPGCAEISQTVTHRFIYFVVNDLLDRTRSKNFKNFEFCHLNEHFLLSFMFVQY